MSVKPAWREIGFVGVLGGFGPAGLGLGGGRVGIAGGHLAHPLDEHGIDGALAPEGGDLLATLAIGLGRGLGAGAGMHGIGVGTQGEEGEDFLATDGLHVVGGLFVGSALVDPEAHGDEVIGIGGGRGLDVVELGAGEGLGDGFGDLLGVAGLGGVDDEDFHLESP